MRMEPIQAGAATQIRDQLRLIFMREGKLAGQAWPWLDDDTPKSVREHLLVLLTALGDQLVGLSEAERDGLMGLFFRSGRAARTAESGISPPYSDLSADAIIGRVKASLADAVAEDKGGEKAAEQQSAAAETRKSRIEELRERLAGKEEERRQAERDRATKYVVTLDEVSREYPELLGDAEHVTPARLSLFSSRLVSEVVQRWPTHGGQHVDDALAEFFAFAISALLRDADPATGVWDATMEDGSIFRYSDSEALIQLHINVSLAMLRDEAKPHYTYELMQPWTDDELHDVFERVARQQGQEATEQALWRKRVEQAAVDLFAWQVLYPMPDPCPYGASPDGAEYWCRGWLEHMGLKDAKVTQLSGDGGIDIESPNFIVQVKHYTGPVPIQEVRELAGVAAGDGRGAIFMTSGHYPRQAPEFADRVGMLLYHYDVTTADVTPMSSLARAYLETGFLTA